MTRDSRHRDIDKDIQADMEALRATSQHRLKPLADTLGGLSKTQPQGAIMSTNKSKKRWMRIAVAAAILTAAGAVFAAAGTNLFSISVDTDGKTDQEVEGEIREQLVDQGVDAPEVDFKRNHNQMKVDIAGEKDGREFRIVQKHKGDNAASVVEMQPPRLDTEREPGMTDAELEAKIKAQMDALGLEGEVKVKGDDIRIRAKKREQH